MRGKVCVCVCSSVCGGAGVLTFTTEELAEVHQVDLLLGLTRLTSS